MGPATDQHEEPELQLRERFGRVAIAHDWLTVPGGSEQVLLELLAMFPQAELFTSVFDPAPWPAEITERPVHASFLNRLPGASRHYPQLLPLMDAAFRSFDLSRFELVLSSSHACAKNVRAPRASLHVCYCHTPMRYAWERDFLAGERIGYMRPLLAPLMSWLRRRDYAGAQGPDVIVANSRYVAGRVARFYKRDAEIVNPPVDVDHFLALEREPQDYYLVFGRIVPYKRVDLAVAACAQLARPLRVAGAGRALDSARAGAGAGAQFLGLVPDELRDSLLLGARALLFPGEEDFGIVPVEAQAAGVPVIAYGRGGAAETVIDGQTGVLFEEQSVSCLVEAIRRFEGLELDPAAIRDNARRFKRERFRREMAHVIASAAARRDRLGSSVAG